MRDLSIDDVQNVSGGLVESFMQLGTIMGVAASSYLMIYAFHGKIISDVDKGVVMFFPSVAGMLSGMVCDYLLEINV